MSIRKWTLIAALAVLALPAAAQQGTGSKETKAAKPAPAPATETQPKPATEDPTYTIGADDQLSISVWKEPEITRVVPVRPDGKISLPLINDVQAAGLTPTQLSMTITEKLRKFISDPQVSVIVMAINSRRYFIVGEVGRAGAFPLMPGTTVLQALAAGGGFTQFANLKGIYVMRVENGKQVKFPFNYKDAIKGLRPEQNIVLKPGDTIVVP